MKILINITLKQTLKMSEKSFEKGLKLIMKNLDSIINSITLTYIEFEDLLLEQDEYPIGYFVQDEFEIIGAFKQLPDVSFYTCYIFASKKKGDEWILRNDQPVDYEDDEWSCDVCGDILEDETLSVRLTEMYGIYTICESCKTSRTEDIKVDYTYNFKLTDDEMYRFGFNTYNPPCLKFFVEAFDFMILKCINICNSKEFEWDMYNYYNYPKKQISNDGTISYCIGFDMLHNYYGPAIKRLNGSEEYFEEGQYHRIEGPAFINQNGLERWYIYGELHSQYDNPCCTYPDGSMEWRYAGKYHRTGDKPALINSDGTNYYYNHGLLHRNGDNPSIVYENGDIHYYKYGEPHREGDNPSSIFSNGTLEYCKNGKLHREGDLPSIIRDDGRLQFYKNGRFHRDGDLPAIEFPGGAKLYCKNGYLHREGDKPAVINPDPEDTREIFMKIKDEEEPVRFAYNYEYWVYGRRHRKHGLPAVYHKDGKIEKYYVNGEKHNLYGCSVKDKFKGYNEFWVDDVLVSNRQFEILQKRFFKTLKEERKLLVEYWCKWFEWLMDMSEDAKDPKTGIIRGVKYFDKRILDLDICFNDLDTPDKFNMKLNDLNYTRD